MSHPVRTIRSMALRTSVTVAAFAAFGLLAVACSDSRSISTAGSAPSSDNTLVAPATTTVHTTLEATTTAPVDTTMAPVTTVTGTVAPPPPPAPTCAVATAPTRSLESVPSGYNLGVFGVTDEGCAFQFDD